MSEMQRTSGSGSAESAVSPTGTARLVVRRTMAASPEEVFAAWTSAESMEQWMHAGPTESARVSIDPRPGGALRIDMIGGGQVYEHRGEFLEVIPPRRLVFTWISKGTGQQRSVVTVEIAPHGAGSEVVLTHERLPDESAARAHTEGWSSILDGLSRKLAS